MEEHIKKIVLLEDADEQLVLSFICRLESEAADNLLIEFASHEMRERLEYQRSCGIGGWNTAQCTNFNLKERLLKNAANDDWVDVINLAAMLLARSRMFKEIPLNGGR